MDTITITETGCYLDNHRGHYIQRDAIWLAEEFGYILGEFEKFALNHYDEYNSHDGYPHEALTELCDDAIEWLNSGQDQCIECHGTGKVWETAALRAEDNPPLVICKACSGTGRGPRIDGQNFPPKVPAGAYWSFNDGDFGLYLEEDLI